MYCTCVFGEFVFDNVLRFFFPCLTCGMFFTLFFVTSVISCARYLFARFFAMSFLCLYFCGMKFFTCIFVPGLRKCNIFPHTFAVLLKKNPACDILSMYIYKFCPVTCVIRYRNYCCTVWCRCRKFLREVPEQVALQAIDEFTSVDRGYIRKVSAYFMVRRETDRACFWYYIGICLYFCGSLVALIPGCFWAIRGRKGSIPVIFPFNTKRQFMYICHMLLSGVLLRAL